MGLNERNKKRQLYLNKNDSMTNVVKTVFNSKKFRASIVRKYEV